MTALPAAARARFEHRGLAWAVCCALAAACVAPNDSPDLGVTRGYILISLDTVGAVHLGCYGAPRDTTPFLDSLAERGVLFENAFVQYPSTLVSHVSMFTGLYPKEHGVYPPESVLSTRVPVLPELFQQNGFRTSGHTEGGFVAAHYGFERGFDDFDDTIIRTDTDVEKTFGRGLAFLRGLQQEEPFFLFLHTYSAHDPYEPPAEYLDLFVADLEPAFDSSKGNLASVNAGFRTIDAETLAVFRARYDAGLRYLDDVLRRLFEDLDGMGLLDETTVVITADHGEEFLEHGRLGHSQVYPETLRVPLIVLHPALEAGRRVAEVVESIDIAPTLYELAGIEGPPRLSGESLVPLLAGASASGGGSAYAEVAQDPLQETLVATEGSGEGRRVLQVISTSRPGEADGTWVTRTASFDVAGAPRIAAVAFAEPRTVGVSVDGEAAAPQTLGTDWAPLSLPLAAARRQRVILTTEGCASPRSLGLGDDGRCLSFKLRGQPLRRSEFFDLDADPTATRDLSFAETALYRRLAARMLELEWRPVEAPGAKPLSAEAEEQLRALGYVQ